MPPPPATPYDTVAYPSAIFRQAQPDRMAMVARLHGLDAPAVETARYLDIGGGDGLHAIALAAAFPRAEFVNFDLAQTAVVRGTRWAQAAGLTNVRHFVLDIVEAAERLEGPFDYIVAHGVYAWVPAAVRAAIFPLIGRLLSPAGVALVSFNALPGGYSRLAVRGLLRSCLDLSGDPAANIAAVRDFLAEFAEPQEHDEPIVAAMRREAAAMARRPGEVIFHDELGGTYAPQTLADVAADAAASGLAHLNEGGKSLLARAFRTEEEEEEGIDEAGMLRRLQAQDFVDGRYFRNSLFVRAGRAPSRTFEPERMLGLWASAFVTEPEPNLFRGGEVSVEVRDPGLAESLRRLRARWPARIALADLTTDPDRLAALFRLAVEGMVDFHTVDAPFSVEPGPRPCASALVRSQLEMGMRQVAALDHRTVDLDDPRARRFVAMLDGRRDRSALEADWSASADAADIDFDAALTMAARGAMLVR